MYIDWHKECPHILALHLLSGFGEVIETFPLSTHVLKEIMKVHKM